MAILDPTEAVYFASGYLRGRTTQESFREWGRRVATGQRFSEGAPRFNEFRDLSLGEVERLLLLSASHYRRAHEGFGEVSAPWAYVTLYYGSFFVAKALMGIFGVWLTDRAKIITVARSYPGSQQFECRRYVSPTGAGSHAQFWELYYNEMAVLVPYLTATERFAVQPPGADFDWQCDERNRVNYDSYEALELARQFGAMFTTAGFPGSLPGSLNTQYRFLETALLVCGQYARSVGLNTDAVDALCALPSRTERVKQLVLTQKPSPLGNKAKRKAICG